MMHFTKAPPPPPFHANRVLPKPSIVTAYKRIDCPDDPTKSYELPMAGHEPAWLKVLRDCDFPTDVVVIDFESYFDAEYGMGAKASSLSTIEYVMDERWEILGCGFTRVQSPTENYGEATVFQVGLDMVMTQINCLKRLYGDNLERCTVVMQNANFDALVLSRHFNIHPPYVIDLLGLLRHWLSRAKNDLDTAADREDLIEKGDTSQFSGMTFRTRFVKMKSRKRGPKMPVQRPKATAEQIAALRKYGTNDCLREWELFTIMLPRLSNPKVELRLMQHHLELFTKPRLYVDYTEADRIVGLMQAEIDRVLAEVGCTKDEISGDISFEKLLYQALSWAGDSLHKYQKLGKISEKTGKQNVLLAIAKDDPERELLLKHEDERVRLLIAARIAIGSWPNHIARVQRIVRQARANGGLLCVPLKYHGAHTGRASGGERINLQNLGSRGHELINAIRNLLLAGADEILVIVDASQIEARVLAWIARQEDLMADFELNVDVYVKFASDVTGFAIRKAVKEKLWKERGCIPAVEKRMEQGRALGKVGVLGCGYGMGTDRILEYANNAPYFCNIDILMAEKIKKTYREKNAKIVQFWKDIERAFLYTAKYKKPCVLRNLRFDPHPEADVVITLPNGRELKYHKVRTKADDRGDKLEIWNEIEHHWEHTWGGSLTENVVQAMSRDILMEAMLRLEDRGLHIAHHIHDELVGITAQDQGEDWKMAAIEEMSRRPWWATDCPLAAEGLVSKRYGKH